MAALTKLLTATLAVMGIGPLGAPVVSTADEDGFLGYMS